MRRLSFIGLALLSGSLGWASRRYTSPGSMVYAHAGDLLWAIAVAALLRAALARRVRRAPGFALACAVTVGIEASQLLEWPWLVELRTSRLGGLLLGHGFSWHDVALYVVGCALTSVLEGSQDTSGVAR